MQASIKTSFLACNYKMPCILQLDAVGVAKESFCAKFCWVLSVVGLEKKWINLEKKWINLDGSIKFPC